MDWNNDGKKDLIAGDTKGNVTLFLNEGTTTNPELAAGTPVQSDGKPISSSPKSHKLADVYSKIHMADWDADGLKDLLVGHQTTVVIYKNEGTPSSPRFGTPKKMDIPGNTPSRPSPYVVDWDGDGKKDLLLGSERPQIFFYRNIGTDESPKLENGKLLNTAASGFEAGSRCRFDVTDWNNDGKLDLLVGNRCRGAKPSSGGNLWLFFGK